MPKKELLGTVIHDGKMYAPGVHEDMDAKVAKEIGEQAPDMIRDPVDNARKATKKDSEQAKALEEASAREVAERQAEAAKAASISNAPVAAPAPAVAKKSAASDI